MDPWEFVDLLASALPYVQGRTPSPILDLDVREALRCDLVRRVELVFGIQAKEATDAQA